MAYEHLATAIYGMLLSLFPVALGHSTGIQSA